ncbi:MAG: hypothetical protein EB059_02440 [Alphaproteobacteria bacterium]|nr:hypothetical protein [Alphaproteobacteria bacterium]
MTSQPDLQSNKPEPIYPEVSNPYYIIAPPYVRTSAGSRVLHLLCHSLNRKGHMAYLYMHPALPWRKHQICPDLLAPVLNEQIVQSHFERGIAPIMVYPETITGNPFGSPCVVRYVLNFPGLLGGDTVYASEELCFSYGEVLAAHTREPHNILFLPMVDTRIYYPPPEGQKRQGTCFYADKYQVAHHGQLFDITKDSVEITRNKPDSQTPDQIADLFRRSELFYVYENTALAIEAVLCGCPVVFLPNEHLTDMIALKEIGKDGYAWGAEPEEIARAKATVRQGAENYLKSYAAYWNDLDHFIAATKKHVEGKLYKTPVCLPSFFDVIRYVIRDRGLARFIQTVFRKLYYKVLFWKRDHC